MLCAVLVASGCGDDGSAAAESVTTTFPSTTAASIAGAPGGDAPPSTPPPSTAPPATIAAAPSTAPVTVADPLSDDDQVFAAVRRYFEAVVEANDPPDPTSTLFDAVATPDRADALRTRAQQNFAARRGIRWPADRQPLVRAPRTVLRHDSIAVVDTCVRDSLVTYDLDSDAALNNAVSFFWVQLTVTDHFGPLLVSQYRRIQDFQSEGPCVDAYQ